MSSLHSRPNWPAEIKSLQIGEQNFEVERCSPHKKGFIVKLKSCASKAQADKFQFQEVFLDKNLFKSQADDSFYLMELLGFAVKIEGEQGTGRVLRFESDGKSQDFLIIEFSEEAEESFLQDPKSDRGKIKKALSSKSRPSERKNSKTQKNSQKTVLSEPSKTRKLHKKTYSIPLVKTYIKKIDFKNKQIHLKLPDSFLSLF